jgi:hypothetical protein
MKLNKLLLVATMIVVVAMVSGCICCYGMDGMFSKLKKPVTAINFPSTLSFGGKTYDKIYSNEYLDSAAVKTGARKFAGKLGYGTGDIAGLIDKAIDLSGVNQYKSFKYSDGTKTGTIGGFVAKTDAPSTVTGGYEGDKAMATAGESTINDPSQNQGSVSDVSNAGTTELGNGGDRFMSKVDGQDCYVIVVKYSNLYISAYSFESFDADEAAINMAIGQIDEAAAS